MIQRKMNRSHGYTAETTVAAQHHAFIAFLEATGRPAWRSSEARVMINSTSAQSIHCYTAREVIV